MSEDVVVRVKFSREAEQEMKKFFTRIGGFFKGLFANKEAIKAAFDRTFELSARALPYLETAATIASGITPSKVDDLALAAIKTAYPRLFDGSITTGDELKLYTLGVATTLLKQKYPEVSTTVARLAVQTAYAAKKEGESDK